MDDKSIFNLLDSMDDLHIRQQVAMKLAEIETAIRIIRVAETILHGRSENVQ